MEFFEEKLNEYEADSFDLKMQHYYSKMKTSGKTDVINDCDTIQQCFGVSIHDNIEMRENSTGRRKMAQLETELSEVRASNYAEAGLVNGHTESNGISLTGSNILGSKSNDLAHLSENRRRERQATTAVAEHDTILIHQLQRAISMLQSRHDDDTKQARDNDQTISRILQDNNEKSLLIAGLEIECQKANALIRSLRAQLTSTTTLLENERNSNRIAREDAFTAKEGERYLIGTQEEKRASSLHFAANQINEMTSNCGRKWSATPRWQGGGETDSHFIFPNKELHSKISRISRGEHSALRGQQQTQIENSCSNGILMASSSHERVAENFRTPNAKRPDTALEYSESGYDQLRAENIELQRTLEKERILLRDQEIVVNKIRDSAVEITLLEAEEIARLENDLAQCYEEKDHWRGKCRSAQYLAEDLTQQVNYLDLLIKKNGFTLPYHERDAFDYSKRHR